MRNIGCSINTEQQVYSPTIKIQKSKCNDADKIEQKYAIVIPCYNEEERFPYHEFLKFARQHRDVLLCFVNDGSKDNTISSLRGLQYECTDNVIVCDIEINGGKSKAVRHGILHVYHNYSITLIGFLDADLATTPEEWYRMAIYKEEHPQFGMIVGSRIQRLGADIIRNDNRSFFSKVIKKAITVILKSSFQDTQCGAKIFHKSIIPYLFNETFMTPWLFDIEIFLRLQEKFGKSTLQKGVLEYPLMHWREIGDSKLKMKHAIKMPIQLFQIYKKYRLTY